MRLPTDIKAALADQALDAFWQVVAQRFPQAQSGDLCWDVVFNLQTAAEQAIQQWVEYNVPGYDPGITFEDSADTEITGASDPNR